MEQFNRTVEDYQQQIQQQNLLSALLPQLKEQLEQQKDSLPDLRLAVSQTTFDLKKAENPGFLTRLLGRQEDQMAKSRNSYYAAVRALDSTTAEISDLERRIQESEETLTALDGCADRFYDFLRAHTDTIPQAQQILYTHLVQEAIAVSRKMSDVLELARPWMRQDVLRSYVSYKNQKLELLSQADALAARFCLLLGLLPDGIVILGASLSSPQSYITGATMEAAQLDRLDIALNQALKAREALREYLKTL